METIVNELGQIVTLGNFDSLQTVCITFLFLVFLRKIYKFSLQFNPLLHTLFYCKASN